MSLGVPAITEMALSGVPSGCRQPFLYKIR